MKRICECFSVKKIYPNTLKLIIVEKTPIAILHSKKKKFYISDKGDLINFIDIEIYKDLPIVFGNGRNFYSLYKDLQKIKSQVAVCISSLFHYNKISPSNLKKKLFKKGLNVRIDS